MHKTGLNKLHFGLLVFLMLHFLFSSVTAIQINAAIVFWPKLLAFLSGIILFIISWKNQSKLKYYFSLYVISPLIVLIGFLLDGLLGAILASFFFFFSTFRKKLLVMNNFRLQLLMPAF